MVDLRQGYDADIVIWNGQFTSSVPTNHFWAYRCSWYPFIAHPLTTGSAPTQVIIDGIPQLPLVDASKRLKKADKQQPPPSGNFEWHIKQAQTVARKSGGLTGIKEVIEHGSITYVNVSTIYRRGSNGGIEVTTPAEDVDDQAVVMDAGKIICLGHCQTKGKVINLHRGTITPGLISFGSQLGLEHISGEAATTAGTAPDVDFKSGKVEQITKASDALLLGSRDAM